MASVSALMTALSRSDPLFAASSGAECALASSSTWEAATSIICVAQQRAQEMDTDASRRAATLMNSLLTPPGAHGSTTSDGAQRALQLVLEHTVNAIAQVVTNSAKTVVANDAGAMLLCLKRLITASLAGGGPLAEAASYAIAAHVARSGPNFESVCPSLLVEGVASARDLVRHLTCPRDASILAALEATLQTSSDLKQRATALACCQQLWERAVARWPLRSRQQEEDEDGGLQGKEDEEGGSVDMDVRSLATLLINTQVDTIMFDPVARLRLAATCALRELAPALDTAQVLKCTLLKVRDKDKHVRTASLKVCAAATDAEGLARRVTSQELQQLVLHGRASDVPANLQAFVGDVFWAYLIARQQHMPEVLAELRVVDQRELYEPLLAMHPSEMYEAVYGDGSEDDTDRTE